MDSIDVKKAYVHSTWAGTYKCRPEIFLQPKNVEEIRQIVQRAAKVGKTVTLTGSGHSPSVLTMTREWLVNLDKFNKVLSVEPHETGKWTDVSVEAGMRVYQLNEHLAKLGLAIQNLGSISDQSMAGIIATGTHGSSAYHGLVSQQIVNFTIMVADGQLIKCSPTENQDLFRAGLVSLGKLGIITHVTIRTIPSYTLESTAEVVPFDKFMDELWDEFWTSKEFTRVWWFPYSRHVVLWRANKSDKPPTPKSTTFYDTKLGRIFYESLLWVSVKILPRLTPFIEKWVFGKQFGYKDSYGDGVKQVHESVEGHNIDCLFSQYVNEWAMPLTSGPKVMRQLEHAIHTAADENRFYVHAPFEVRISNTTCKQTSDELDPANVKINGCGAVAGNELRPLLDGTPRLSPGGVDKYDHLTLYLNATIYRPFGWSAPIDTWYQEFEQIVSSVGGKPHWAKNFLGFQTDPVPQGEMRGLGPVMSEWYGDDLQLYRQLRQKYDPQGMFLGTNNWAEINGLV